MKVSIQGILCAGHVDPFLQAQAIAEAGFHGFYMGEHHHFPAETPVPEFYKDTGVPEFYKYSLDPLITLGALATAQPGLHVGTSILLAPLHDTLMLSSRLSTLDNLTKGRTLIGIGIGWNQPEFANHGVDFDSRFDKTVEQVRAMRQLWKSETTAYSGDFVQFAESWQTPKPYQKPGPPLVFGGRALKRSFRFIAELLDGWMPTDTYERTFGGVLEDQIAMLNAMVEDAGRDPSVLRNVMLHADLALYDRDPATFALEAPTLDQLQRLEGLGFDEVVIGVPTFSEKHFRGALDHLRNKCAHWLER